MEQAGGDATLYKAAIGALCTVIVFLVGVVAKLAKFAWDERMARLNDHRLIERSVEEEKERRS